MEVSNDPYELKLYQMFQSCESKQCDGLLDEDALRRLCTLLELNDKGNALITSLERNGSLKLGVSFEQFKEALLNFLGTEFDGSAATLTTSTMQFNKERSLVITDDEKPTYIESPTECSDREISPKLIVGSKKYGRRSRPLVSSSLYEDDCSITESDNTDEDQQQRRSLNGCTKQSNNVQHVQRSASQTDIPASERLRATQLSGSKLKRCSSLPARKNLQAHKLNAAKTKATTKTKAQQHQQQQQQQQMDHSSSLESLDIVTPTQLETISIQTLIDVWVHAHMPNPSGILRSLGYDIEDETTEVQLPQIIKVLEEELRSSEDAQLHGNMLRALLALQNLELCNLRHAYRQLYAENVKLRADNKEANRRVALLAIEIDERHNILEENSKKQIEALEQRHANIVRELTLRMSNDRDSLTSLTARLESRIKHLEQEEIKLKTELDLVHAENVELESETHKAQKQLTVLLEKNTKLNNDLINCNRMAKANASHDSSSCRGDGAEADKSSDDEVMHLMEKITTLQLENAELRDKNDELSVEVENLQLTLQRSKSKQSKSKCTDDASATDTEDQNAAATAIKRRGESPSNVRCTEESPRLGKLRKKSEDEICYSEQSDTSGEWLPLNSELQRSQNIEDVVVLKQKINELEQQLQAMRAKTKPNSTSNDTPQSTETEASSDGAVNVHEERCKELEVSLEQMQRAYEECEDYWQLKLSEERDIFEKERQIYEDEQHENDKKFTELMEKVREYEEQFSKDGRLSPIDERDILEQQYLDLENELVELRNTSMQMLNEKSKEVENLQNEVEDLRIRLGESVEILTGACELSSETVAAHQQQNDNVLLSPASSPINYLWHQSTIHEPAKNINCSMSNENAGGELTQEMHTTIISLTSPMKKSVAACCSTTATTVVTPIQKPSRSKSPEEVHSQQQQTASEGEIADCETSSSTSSNKSFETHSNLSTHGTTKKPLLCRDEKSTSPSSMKEELKRLKFFEISLKEQIKDLSLQRDGLVMELQQLQEARPVLEKAYARTTHPTVMQRVSQLELKNRHLQNVISKQHEYTDSLMQQQWRQHQVQMNELHSRIENQGAMLAEQTQRLQNADILVKDLYVENAHLTATVQRLEQQRARVNLLHQQQQQQQQQRAVGVLPGMP